jgi:DNA-binding MarR family transcriptional regulator
MARDTDLPDAALRLGGDLRVAVGRVARRLRQLYATDDPVFSQLSVLSRLARNGPATPTVLAAAEQVRPQAMGATLRELERRGLVRRRPDPSDRRKVRIELTGAGGQAIGGKHQAINQRLARALANGFTPAEQEQLAAALPLLDRLADQL